MTKLNLIIADIDEAYIKGLSGYLNSYHTSAFAVSCFTKIDPFVVYLERQPPVDILLAGPEFCETVAGYSNVRLKMVLSSKSTNQEYPGYMAINRFSTGEKLIGEVIHLYSKLNASELGSAVSVKETRLVGVYSPVGGAGKTTIAASLAIQCNKLGMKAFYLNLEAVYSGSVFFHTDNKRNLSYVFYYLKEKSNNLPFRMEGIKSSDTDTGVDFFSSPESPLEYSEIDARELEQLIQGIKGIGCYDYIFVDMSSTFDMKNYRLMSLSDHTILVKLPEIFSMTKTQVFCNELSKLKDGCTGALHDKLITVVNKYKRTVWEVTDEKFADTSVQIMIPEYTRVLVKEDGRLTIDDESFWKAVNELMNSL